MSVTESLIDLSTHLKNYQSRIQHILQQNLPSSSQVLHRAMAYAVLNGGKRIRPLLTYTTGSVLNAPIEILDIAACAVELIHCYSLIHDDLPALDNDDLRRGQPTCHKAFDEVTAILAGDALQALAFKILSQPHKQLTTNQQVAMLHTLSEAATHMVEGQAIDIESKKREITLAELEFLCAAKTGALIEASVKLGYIAANCQDERIIENLDNYACSIGLAFQISDDILDADEKQPEKSSYCYLVGIENTKKKATDLYEEALESLRKINLENTFLAELGSFIVQRYKSHSTI